LRLDADWYDSTKEILQHLAPRVVASGLIIVDDYYVFQGCTRAINEFAAEKSWMVRQHQPGSVCHIIA
jgi:O-methyltransferase